jgi:4-hydroxy-tetrahydrodipicolinate reductase
MSATDIIITGAAGRMGSTLIRLAGADPDCNLAAAVEQPEGMAGLAHLDCDKGSDIGEMLRRFPRAVVIDFTVPDFTETAIRAARECGSPMVIGTTGLSDSQKQTLEEAAGSIPLFWAPNMSPGINVLLSFLPKLAKLLGPAYDVEISEIHHKHKKDAPSGTALKLGEVLAQEKGWDRSALRCSREGIIGERPQQEIGAQTIRGGDVVGEHTVYFLGPGERIDVTHRVYSRDTFAQGALQAAKWLRDQGPGRVYSMADMFADALG